MTRNRWLAGVAAGVVLLGGGGLLLLTPNDSGHVSGSHGSHATAHPSHHSTKGGSARAEIAPVQTVPEGQSTSGSATGLPGLRPRAAHRPLVKRPLPRVASRRGALVAGYPRRVLPLVPGGRIRASSVSPRERSLELALDARADVSADDVLRFYAVRLGRWGFAGSRAPAVGGSRAVSFTRGKDAVLVTVTPLSKRSTRYSIFGTLHSVAS